MAAPIHHEVEGYTYGDYLSRTDGDRWEVIDGVPHAVTPSGLFIRRTGSSPSSVWMIAACMENQPSMPTRKKSPGAPPRRRRENLSARTGFNFREPRRD